MSENRFFETMQRQAGEIQTGSNVEIISKNVVFNDTFTEITSYDPITIEEFNKIADGTANLQLVGTVTQEEATITVTLFFKKAADLTLPGGVGRQICCYSIDKTNIGREISNIILALFDGNITLTMYSGSIPSINSSAEKFSKLQYIGQKTSNGNIGYLPILTGNSIDTNFLISDKDWTNNSITLTPSSASEFVKSKIGVGRNYLLEISFKVLGYDTVCIIVGAASNFTTTQSFILYQTNLNNPPATPMLVSIKSSYISDTKSLKLEFFVNKTFGSGTYTDGLEDFKKILSTITPYIL